MEKWKDYVQRYDTILAFLGLEILALTAFTLGGTQGLLIFRMLGFFIALAMIPFIEVNHSPKELKGYLIGLIPLGVFAILCAFSSFWVTVYSGSMLSGIVNDLTVMLGIVGFFVIGFGLKNIKSLKMDWILLVLGCSLGLLVLIMTIYGLARYGFFYASRFAGYVYYYQGAVFHIDTETKILNGWSFDVASKAFGCVSAFLLACALPACIYVSPKKDLKRFLIIFGLGILGLFSLVVIPYTRALKLLIPVYLFAIIYRFIKVKKEAPRWLEITGFVLLCLVVLGLLLLFIDAFATSSFLANLPLVGRYFQENGFFYAIESAISHTFFKYNVTRGGFNFLSFLFGCSVNGDLVNGAYLTSLLTQSFEFNILFQNGFLAFAALVVFILMMFVHARNYLAQGEGLLSNRLIPVLMLLGGFIYFSLLADEQPLVYSSSFMATTRGSQFYLLFFLAGLVYSPKAAAVAVIEAGKKPAEPVKEVEKAPEQPATLEEVPLNDQK
jgi:hypothetical protein